ncbi:hypothetical protein WJX73_007621 [Symbiochloris irregularis]|uniref:NADP-dependent oxidoreductase domain-containing protein n=1 Tax=Symbiochloris irregularis TaxID=706552 RepID=A0AAW1NT74_9CHLO
MPACIGHTCAPQAVNRAPGNPLSPTRLSATPSALPAWAARLQNPFATKPANQRVSIGPLTSAPIGFGTWSWGNQFLWGYSQEDDEEIREVFNLLVSKGVNLFDTADSYGTGRLNGQSEKLLGKFIREYPGSAKERDGVLVATKLAAYPWRVFSGQFVQACRGSLKRMGKESLAIGQLHWSTANYAPPQERALWDGLAAMYDQGLVEAVGVSNYGPKQLAKIHAYLTKLGVPLASVQVQFSLLSKGKDQMATKAACEDLGLRLIAYSPLALGMLTGRYDAQGSLPKGPRGLLFRQILPGAQPLLQTLKEVADGRGRSMSQVAINWCMCQGAIPIPGARSLSQARDNLGALDFRLSSAEVDALSQAADGVPRPMIQNIFQTS